MTLTLTSWLWGDKYDLEYVAKLRAGLRRHVHQPHRYILFTDRNPRNIKVADVECRPIEDMALTRIKGCMARIRMFDPDWQQRHIWPHTATKDDRLINIDLDAIITSECDTIFNRKEDFCIMGGGNASNPCPYNGALIMIRPGARAHVWHNFSLDAAMKAPFHEFPDDQGWIWSQITNAPTWQTGQNGVYVYLKPGWPAGSVEVMPPDARLIAFIGQRSPRSIEYLGWVQEHWRE